MQQMVKKGDELAVKGKLMHRKYEDSNGQTRYVTEVVVNEFIKLKKRESTAAESALRSAISAPKLFCRLGAFYFHRLSNLTLYDHSLLILV